MTISGNFERFQYFNFEKKFLQNENLFQKTRVPFLVKSTKIESASFPYKTLMSEDKDNDKYNIEYKMDLSQEQSLASNYLIFVKTLFQFKNLL